MFNSCLVSSTVMIWRLAPVGNFQLTDQWSAGSGEVFCSTVHSFKGLESPVVILAEIEPYGAQDLEAVLYVGCSWACNHLVVLASARLPEDVKQRLISGESREANPKKGHSPGSH